MKIYFIINKLGPGGAERVASLLINRFVKDHEVSLLSRQASNEFFYKIDPKVSIIQVIQENGTNSPLQTLKYIWSLKRHISAKKPDLIISYMTEANVLSLIAFILSRILDLNFISKIKVSERTDPTRHKVRRQIGFLRYLFYRFSSQLVLQSSAIVSWGEKLINRSKITIIPNPVDVSELRQHSISSFKPEFENYVLHVGRFTVEKGQDLLIEAFFLIADVNPALNLILIGEGPEKEKLYKKVEGSKFANRILFLNNRTNIIDYLLTTKLFVLCSRYEGFPNVLMEALACGTPSISLDCKSGPRELLKGSMSNYLVPENDIVTLAKKMLEVSNDTEAKQKFETYSSIIQKEYSTEMIAEKWLK